MKRVRDLSDLDWQLHGVVPHIWWRDTQESKHETIPAPVPGSVQLALRSAGQLEDWEQGYDTRNCEWVENRHWIYETVVPDEWLSEGGRCRLRCKGLDGPGWILWDGEELYRFDNAHVPHVIDLPKGGDAPDGHWLRIVFDCPPRWLGQFGYTSQIRDWKPRFNYHWDWTYRLVQIGIWDEILIEILDDGEIEACRLVADADPANASGRLAIGANAVGPPGAVLRAALSDGAGVVREQTVPLADWPEAGLTWGGLPVELWWPNGMGAQKLYTFELALSDARGAVLDTLTRRVGFRHVDWAQNEDAPDGAEPWICVVNGKPMFIQGANWTPIRPNFADLTEADYRKRLHCYASLHFNLMRVWGGAMLERTWFYDLCDELGILVWQEFPLSSSGRDNYPPDDDEFIEELSVIARSFIARRQHHASLVIWCGGNELCKLRDDPRRTPITLEHPAMARLSNIVQECDSTRRFLPSTPSGPSFMALPGNFGKGVHWAVNGPWQLWGDLEEWEQYWRNSDALAHTETGAGGPSSADLIRRHIGDHKELPVDWTNPLYTTASGWYIEYPQFEKEHGRAPESLDEFVQWGQKRHADAVRILAQCSKDKFPKCGGVVIWMGHDSATCTCNSSVIDFDGNPKPAALALGEVFKKPLEEQGQ